MEKLRERTVEDEEYDLETQLATAERRYAQTRERSRRALDECHLLEADLDARVAAVMRARECYDAAEAKRLQLKRLIEELEAGLD